MTPFVSRAGQKLEHALKEFKVDVEGLVCADLGCSTGGFTDCLLQNGAKKVYAVDTGYGVLEWKLRNDERVEVMERKNALHVELPEKMDFVCIDTGWTRQKLIIPKAIELLKPNGTIISLVKPHYEAEKEWLFKGKVKDEHMDDVLDKVKEDLKNEPIEIKDMVESPVVGKKGGNVEFLMFLKT